MDEYAYYYLACINQNTVPYSARRFEALYGVYKRDYDSAMSIEMDLLDTRKQLHLIHRWRRLINIASMVDFGRELVTASSDNPYDPDAPDTGAPGVRVPIHPRPPVLLGSAKKQLPITPDPEETLLEIINAIEGGKFAEGQRVPNHIEYPAAA